MENIGELMEMIGQFATQADAEALAANIYGKVGRSNPTTPALVKQAGGIFKGLWVTEDAMLVMFEDAEQAPPRTSLTVKYTDMHESGDPVGFIRNRIQESRKKFREANNDAKTV